MNSKDSLLSIVFLGIAVMGSLLMSYYVVAREMTMVFQAAVFVLVFLLCFFSVKVSLILLIISMLLSPEIVMGSTPKRDITLRLEDLMLFIMTLGWLFRMAIFKDIGLIVRNPLNRPIALFSILAVVSTSLGVYNDTVNPLTGFFFVLKLIEYFILFNVIVNYVTTEKDVKQLLNILLITCGIVTVYCIFQALTGGDISAPFEGSEGERNTLGGYLVLMGAVSTGILFYSESRFERHAITMMLPLLAIVLMVSLSRSGWVSSIIAIMVLFFTVEKRKIYFIPVFLLILIIPLIAPESVEERFNFTFTQEYHEGEQVSIGPVRLDTSSSARIISFQIVLREIFSHFIFGRGVTGYMFLDGQFARTLIEMGVVGLATFIWLMIAIHNLIRKTMALDLPPRLHGMTVGFYAGFWGLMAHALTANTFIIVRIAEPFWCLTGLTMVIVLAQAKTVARESTPGQTMPTSLFATGEAV